MRTGLVCDLLPPGDVAGTTKTEAAVTAVQESASRLRIGDRERQAAVLLLGEHWGAGRLDSDEFDDRTGRALRARTTADLALVFHDLPGERSPTRLASARAMTGGSRAASAAAAVVAGTGVMTALLAVTEPHRLQVLLDHAQHLLYRLGG